MKKFIEEYVKFKRIWKETGGIDDYNEDVILKAFEIYKKENSKQ